MSDLSSMRYEVNRARQRNYELHSELNEIENGVYRVYNKWSEFCDDVCNTMSSGAQRVNDSHQKIIEAYELQGEIEKMYVLFKNIELANKKIRACNNKKYYDFENFRTVRKIVCAMLDNLEVNLISDKTIAKAVEVQHLKSPDYWLTCALLSIIAWRNDDKELADRALARACKLDKKNSAVFFLVFNLRMNKEEAALKWFDYYQTCDLTGEDQHTFLMLFSIVSKSITQNCSDAVRSNINSFIEKVLENDMHKSGYSEESMISRIQHYISRMKPNEKIDYPFIAKYCTEVNFLNEEMMCAKNNINYLDFILKTVNITNKEKNDYLSEYIIEIVNAPDILELDVEDEIKYNELIISHQGDVETAKAEFEQIKAHRESEFDIVLEMIDWIYNSGTENINPMVKLNMFTITKDLNLKAIRKSINDYRSKFKKQLNIKINDYETTADFSNEDGEHKKAKQFFKEKEQSLLSTVKIWSAFVGFGAGVLAAAGAIAFQMYMLFALTGIGVLFGIFSILNANFKKKRISRECEEQCTAVEGVIAQLFSNFSSYTEKYNEYDKYADQIEEEFNKL